MTRSKIKKISIIYNINNKIKGFNREIQKVRIKNKRKVDIRKPFDNKLFKKSFSDSFPKMLEILTQEKIIYWNETGSYFKFNINYNNDYKIYNFKFIDNGIWSPNIKALKKNLSNYKIKCDKLSVDKWYVFDDDKWGPIFNDRKIINKDIFLEGIDIAKCLNSNQDYLKQLYNDPLPNPIINLDEWKII